jgi:DNA replication protein DnaC
MTTLDLQRLNSQQQQTFCADCGGSGTMMIAQKLQFDRAIGDWQVLDKQMIPWDVAPMHYGDLYPGYEIAAANCACKRAGLITRRIEKTMGQPEIPADCLQFTFDDFKGRPEYAMAVIYAEMLAEGLIEADGEEKAGLMLVGTTGTGKTTLASCIFRARVEAGQSAVWVDFNDFVSKIRATYSDGYSGPSQGEIINAAASAQFLLLDDLGSLTRGKAFAEDAIEAIRTIANNRWAKKLPTVITSNLLKDQLYTQFGDRVMSRLLGLCCMATMLGKDHRIGGGDK